MVMHPVSSTDIARSDMKMGLSTSHFIRVAPTPISVSRSLYMLGSCPQGPTENTSTHLSRVGMDIPRSNL